MEMQKKKSRKLVIGFIGFLMGVASLKLFLWITSYNPWVTIEVENNSCQKVSKIIVESESHIAVEKNLEMKKHTTIKYQNGGESSFRILIKYADGDSAKSKYSYAEGGYTFKATINDHDVVIKE